MRKLLENFYSIGLVIILNLTALYSFPRIVFLTLLLPGILRPRTIIPVYIFASLSSTLYIFQPGLGFGRIIGSLIIFAVLLDLVKTRRKVQIRNRRSIGAIALFVFVSGMFAGSESFTDTIKFLHLISTMLALSVTPHVDVRRLSEQLFVSSLFILALFYFEMASGILSGVSRRASISENVNENRFAMMLAQMSVICFSFISAKKSRSLQQLLAITASLLAILLMVVSGSRSSLFASIVVLALILAYRFRQVLPVILGLGIPTVVIVTIYKFNVSDYVGAALLERYTLDGLQNSGGSQVRFKVWTSLLPFVANNQPFFGLGFGANNVVEAGAKFGVNKPAHNIILDLFLQLGLLGLTLFTSFFVLLAKEIRRNRDYILLIVPVTLVAVTLLNGVGESIFMERMLWNNVGLVYLFINHRWS